MNLTVLTFSNRSLQTRIVRFCAQLFCLCLAWLSQPLFAADAAAMYQSEVQVRSRDDAAERNRAFTSGLEEVLLKLSGRADTLENPIVRRQIQNTQSLVEGWAYQTRVVEGSEQLFLQITYFQPEVQRLLESAGIPLWPANRPETLVWVVTQAELGERNFAEVQSEPKAFEQLQSAAERRGLPIRFPLLDLEDLRNLDPEQVWAMDEMALRTAAQRYGSESILAVRLFRTLAGETYAKARYLFRDRSLDLESFEDPEASFLESAIALAAEELAATFAVRLSASTSDVAAVTLHVSGVRGLNDYAELLRYIDELAVVNSVQVLAAEGEDLTLQVRAGGQLRQLLETLALERRLSQQSEPERVGQEFTVRYLWQSER